VCIEEEHKTHIVKPLKVILREVQDKVANINSQPLNNDELIILIETSKASLISEFKDLNQSWQQQSKQIEDLYEKFFNRLKDQIIAKSSSQEIIKGLFTEIEHCASNMQSLKQAVQQILDFIPLTSEDENQEALDTKQVKDNIVRVCGDIRSSIAGKSVEIGKIFGEMHSVLDEFT
jgi:hypothetical protein